MTEKSQREQSLILKLKMQKEIRVCSKCFLNENCGHIPGHPQNGCVRFCEIRDPFGKAALIFDFKYEGDKLTLINGPAYSLDFLENVDKDNLEAEIIRSFKP